MRILFLSQWFPFPPNNGSKIRIYHLLKGLSQFHQVDLLSFYDPEETTPDPFGQYPFCSQVRLVPWKPFDPRTKKATLGLFSVKPRSLTDTHSPEMERLISEMTTGGKYDLIIASQLTMASYYPVFAGLPAIFDEIELGMFIDQAYKHKSLAVRLRLRLTWFYVYFSPGCSIFNGCTVVSELNVSTSWNIFPGMPTSWMS
jgi:hypothetical protein